MSSNAKSTRFSLLQGLAMSVLFASSSLSNALEPANDALDLLPPPQGTLGQDEQPSTVYDLSVHDPQTMQALLVRLDQLARQPSPQSQAARIALVLHGPELEYFTIRNYAMHRELVDLAAKLDAFQVIEVKACNSMLRQMGLEAADMPAFIEIVPYGPDEVNRLVGSGYLKM
ncbi:MAG: hypothetical protein KKA36_01890 [Gammaproteobacteria bacterium]|nr:hypothetical protein [Gammaproteobacteria bacterium]MBU2477813.1 hypothetical protein [Gammaproteobacteria bacterium]